MGLPSGSRLGPYAIDRSLGAGGMGEVYRATDIRLNREVAVKVLPASLAEEPGFRARFQREAQAIASLNHPHICVLHDVGHDNSHDYLVMELLDGETLADRLKRGPLPLDALVRSAIQIADALAAAHRRGVVHRDLKPGNVMVTSSGIKVLDFGLAKSLDEDVAQTAATLTKSIPVTARGTVMGTPGYIAPEQLLGGQADARSDIFALGAVLFEMATARRAFVGNSQATVVAAVLDHDPMSSWSDPNLPPLLRRIIAKCLAKDPDLRWQSASDVAEALRWVSEPAIAADARHSGARRRWIWPAAAALAGALLTALVLWLARGELAGEPPVRASIVPAAGTNFAVRDITGTPHFALSPDGQWIVFAAHAPGETPRLWLRSLSSVEPRPLPGTEDASGPFWSPDSRHVAFFARRRLKRIALDGGSIQELAEVNFDVTGGSWSPEGVIVFGGPSNDGFYRISANGGPTERATRLLEERGETGHRWPRFLPGGRSFLYYIRSDKPGMSGVYVGQVGSDARKQIIESRASATFVAPGYVLSDRNGTLMAYPFDISRMELSGEPLPLDDRLSAQMGPSHLPLEGSSNGTLAYWNGLGPVTRLEWHDRSGRLLRQVGPQAHQFSPELSHDGTRLLVTRRVGNMHNELWSAELASGAWSRVTFSPAGARFGVWSADAQRIIYSSLAQNGSRLYERDASGAGQERVIFDPRSWAVFPVDWSHDGQWLIYSASTANAWDVGAVSARDGATRAIVASPSNEIQGQVSPNDRWLAYASDESGTWEVYVTAFPSGEGKWQVSTEGGSQPRWSPDGKELFYLTEDGTLMSAAIRSTSAFAASPPRPLFRTKALRTVAPFRIGYAVGPNGDFLITSVVSEAVEPITIVHNWTAALVSRTLK